MTGLPDFTDKHFAVGDRVKVERFPGDTRTGATGTIIARAKPAHDGWVIRWDAPRFGVTTGKARTVNLVHLQEEQS